MNDQKLERARLLINQQRNVEANKLLISALVESPNNIEILALLSEVNLHQNKLKEAEEFINKAISLRPDISDLFNIKARVLIEDKRFSNAELSLKEAISLNPEDADSFAILGFIKFLRKDYEEALKLSDQALSIDAQNITALNFRSSALLKLGRKEESFKTIQDAFHEDPNNAYTHTNHGWSLLEKGEYEKSLKHFKEALQRDPNFEYAQHGMGEAIKARYLPYRWFLKYAFWIGNMTGKNQWGVIIGFYLLVRGLRFVAKSIPLSRPFLSPVIIILALVAFSTWVITPLSNLFLRLNKYGKFLLNKDEIKSSNFVGISVLIFLISILAYFIGGKEVWLVPAVFGFTMMVPLSSMFRKGNKLLLIYGIILGILGVLAIVKSFILGRMDLSEVTTIYLLGFVIYGWVANFIGIKEDNIK